MARMASGRILVVEDDDTLRDILAEALREDGYTVELAEDGEVALELARRWRPDLLILDLMMPNMDGEELVSSIRQVQGAASLPIIVVSASRRAEEVGARIGARAALRKPFDLFELTERVSEALNGSTSG
jgi:two-component system, OmpR family, response regulator